jgi:hypothetical protein
MKLERRYLNIAIIVLIAAVAYNLFVRGRPAASTRAEQQVPLLSGVVPQARPLTPTGQGVVDPASIPPPPRVDLAGGPVWSNDPFLGPGESRRAAAVAVAAAQPSGAEPVVRTILYSPERRLAIVDNRIVRVGDAVSVGTIVDIARDAIVVRTATGETHRVGLQRGPSLQDLVR